jgi:CRISPR-associated protein Csd1
VLGRTFAVLEMIQKNAFSDKDLNATIKNKYFAAACSNPALVFPTLLTRAQHHLAKIEKIEKGKSIFWEKRLGECLNLLEGESIPKAQNMENQGRFILGYYQQTKKNYETRERNDDGID